MWKRLFLFVLLCCAFSSAAIVRTANADDNPSTYGSYRSDSVAASGSILSRYGSEGSDAIAVTADSGSVSPSTYPSTYGSERSDSVARTEYSRSIEGVWQEGGVFLGGERYLVANGNRGVNPWDRGFNAYYRAGWNYRPAVGWETEQAPEYLTVAGIPQNMNQGRLPPLPTDEELAGFTNQQLGSFIAWISRGFARELGQFNTCDTWVKYFELSELQSAAPQTPTGTVAPTQPDTATVFRSPNVVDDILARMDFASKNNQYQMISDTWGFKALQTALREASRPPEERTASILRAQAKKLDNALGQISTGDSWRRHLEISNIEQLSQQKNISPNEDLEEIARKFDGVAQDPAYQMIVQLPGFQGVSSTLHDLNEGRQPISTAKREPSSTENKNRK